VRKTGAVLLGVLLAAGRPGSATEGSGPSPSQERAKLAFKVVVNPSVGGSKIEREVLARIFLGQARRWSDGKPIVPVDLSSTSAVRETFSADVLGMRVDGVKTHWLRNVAAGGRPPMTKASDQEVLAFVASAPGAVGYVSEAVPVPPTVRVVAVE
jgi:ABC-type phosphate transport system substrate-binding protein